MHTSGRIDRVPGQPGVLGRGDGRSEHRGRLYGLAGDALQWSGPPLHSLRTAAAELGLTLDELTRVCAVLGLTATDVDQIALSQADVDASTTWIALKSNVGEDAALGFLRVLGSAMALSGFTKLTQRLTPAELSILLGEPTPWSPTWFTPTAEGW